MMELQRFNKLWLALAGLGLGWLQRKYQIDLFGVQQELVDLAIMAVTALAVYAVPNKPVPDKQKEAV
jgi:hypothetical protein